MTAGHCCRELHTLLDHLPSYAQPRELQFTDGLYFFYEEEERSEHGPAGRIVRVGNHPRSERGLIRRLKQHYSGRKNGSVFRKYLGGALMRRKDPENPCLAPSPGQGHWEHQKSKPCGRCQPIEQEVSSLLRSRFRFRAIAIQNRSERNRFEALLIATIAACSVCRPSSRWLGLTAYGSNLRRSGLWNSEYVGGPTLDEIQLRRLAELVGATGGLPRQ